MGAKVVRGKMRTKEHVGGGNSCFAEGEVQPPRSGFLLRGQRKRGRDATHDNLSELPFPHL